MPKLREGVVPIFVWAGVSVIGLFIARAGWEAIYDNWDKNGQNFSAPPRNASPDVRTTAVISRGAPLKSEEHPFTTFAQFTLPAAGTAGKAVGNWIPVPQGTNHIIWGTDDTVANEVDTEIELKLRNGRLVGPVPVSESINGVLMSDIRALRASNKRPAKAVTVTFRAAR